MFFLSALGIVLGTVQNVARPWPANKPLRRWNVKPGVELTLFLGTQLAVEVDQIDGELRIDPRELCPVLVLN